MDKLARDGGHDVAAPPEHKARKRGRFGVFMALLLLVAGAGALAWWNLSKPNADHPARHQGDVGVNVKVAPLAQGDMPVVLDGLGTVTALNTVTVTTQISGYLTEVGFQEGQEVKKGDFLAQIDPRPYQAALGQAQGQLARDEAQLAASTIDLARYEKLMTQDSIARQQVDTQRALVKQNEATVASDKALVENATLNLNYCRIVSPLDGRVGLRLVDPGNYVQPSTAGGLVVITQMRPISVIFPLPQDAIPQFIQKLRSGQQLTVQAFDRNASNLLASGTLTTVDNQIDTTTGTVKLRATFQNEDELLFPNQFVNVKLITNTLNGVTLMPNAAVQLGVPGTFVYRTNDDGTVTVRPVKLGAADDKHVVVLEGLSPGDKVVVDGADRLRDGAKITVADDNKKSALGASSSGSPTPKTEKIGGETSKTQPDAK
ncbi:MdtA/MuxA family multidrug efflux RND transporter periplasmic adaptor subunit [Hyphomicrobium sp.]|uniref:MdtA/MuxA family multidrug efflux RND transporter periplasmic adaptor subunit n=1 Tax=Hyphomicrobium sp. TaxID=82 RepID=UPI002E3454FB|nr:MdtA/MuxA family multidrug efflux RND transporter periplasmic adaptor subunit [Hyphomicrobium sp.]HEX2842304.1 MdtA/MuxA family multidrug efflux RND transporter periplasmic adaptor subunit [Hyphomicrobium sp.]